MTIVRLLLAVLVLLIVIPMARTEVRLRRRAAFELTSGLSGRALRTAKRDKLAQLKYLQRPSTRPASNTSDAGSPGGAVDGCGHGAGHS
ncbi:hypothetical protein [Pseudonocardia sp. GCM10023141]|uniref:hypothetical protein n=1 Tax=Pseudonocardia sp. GCM10023141 TaxID=3252653 RepID=UPI00360E7319